MPSTNRQWLLALVLFFALQTGTLAWLRPEPQVFAGPAAPAATGQLARLTAAEARIARLTVQLDDLSKRLGPAIDAVLEREGGYVHDPHDPGGETKYGISKRAHPQLDIRHITREQAAKIYRETYWLPVYGEIRDAAVANKVFDLAVNMGPSAAHKSLQRALRGAGLPAVAVDGILGPITLAAVNRADPNMLLAALRSEAACHYRSLDRPRFLKGWEGRAYS